MAEADFFLEIDGVQGESIDSQIKNALQIESWSFGASQTGSSVIGGGLGVGKVNMQDFNFVVMHSKASATLMQFCSIGKHIPKAKLTCRKATGDGGQKPYLIVTFTECYISSFQTGGSNGSNSLPMEQIAFNFTKIKYQTFEQDGKGILKAGPEFEYDLKEIKKAA